MAPAAPARTKAPAATSAAVEVPGSAAVGVAAAVAETAADGDTDNADALAAGSEVLAGEELSDALGEVGWLLVTVRVAVAVSVSVTAAGAAVSVEVAVCVTVVVTDVELDVDVLVDVSVGPAQPSAPSVAPAIETVARSAAPRPSRACAVARRSWSEATAWEPAATSAAYV